MTKLKDLSGEKFGMLTAVFSISKKQGKKSRVYWHCVCDCGATKEVGSDTLLTGKAKSCGCSSSKLMVLSRKQTPKTILSGGELSPEEYQKQYYQANRDKILKQSKNRYALNGPPESTPELREKRRKYVKNKRDNDPNFYIASKLRTRLNKALNNNFKAGSSVDLLGCTIQELKKFLEDKFSDGMTWDNKGQWHIDHIKPLSSFDLQDIKQLTIACHHTNLQPLWASDNIKKGGKIQL